MKKGILLILLIFSTLSLFAQVKGSEVYMFDLNVQKKGIQIKNPINISNHSGYDNQPFIDKTNNCIYYTSLSNDGTTNFMKYDLVDKGTDTFINSTASLYSATLTPDAKFISCIYTPDTNTQYLAKYSLDTKEPIFLIKDLVIGYHVWVNNHALLLFVLGKENSLHYYDLITKKDTILSKNIGRSLHKIPGKNACSYVQYTSDKERNLMMLDLATMKSSVLIKLFEEHEDVTWSTDGMLFTNDGKDLYFSKPFKLNTWEKVELHTDGIKLEGITRMQIDPDRKFIVLVASETN